MENRSLGNNNSSPEIFIRYVVSETEDLCFVFFVLKKEDLVQPKETSELQPIFTYFMGK